MDDELRQRVELRRQEARAGLAEISTPIGPIDAELLWLVCNGCGAMLHLNFDKLGTDWPEQLEGWSTQGPNQDLCPDCASKVGRG